MIYYSNFTPYLFFTGLFGGGGFKLLGVQLLAIISIVTWTAFWSVVCFKLLEITIGLRVPLHEEILGADIVEHSLNGTYDRKTGEWRDLNGKLLMVIKENQPLEYYDTVKVLLANMFRGNCDLDESSVVKKSAFGFSRNTELEGDVLAMETVTELEAAEEERKASITEELQSKQIPRRRLLWRKAGHYIVNKGRDDTFSNGKATGAIIGEETGGSLGSVGIYNLGDSRNKRGIGSSPMDGSI